MKSRSKAKKQTKQHIYCLCLQKECFEGLGSRRYVRISKENLTKWTKVLQPESDVVDESAIRKYRVNTRHFSLADIMVRNQKVCLQNNTSAMPTLKFQWDNDSDFQLRQIHQFEEERWRNQCICSNDEQVCGEDLNDYNNCFSLPLKKNVDSCTYVDRL
eukprot:Awhi_evm1s2459